MDQVNCLYCGRELPEDTAHCPHCGAVSHYQKKGYRAGSRVAFLIFFLILTTICLGLVFWLPR